MRKNISVLALIATTFTVVSKTFAAPDPNFHIYLAFGQSNMEGAGPIEGQDKTVDKRFQMLATVSGCNGRTAGQWYDATPPLSNCNGKLSPVDYFGRTLVKKLPEQIKVGVVVVAVAGCDIQLFEKDNYMNYKMESWMQNTVKSYGGNPYGRLVEMGKKAQEVGVIKGILLHQGETNSGQQNWPTRVKAIYQNLLTDLGLKAENVPLLAGEVVSSAAGGACGGMNSIIQTLPTTIPTAHVISSQGLTHQGDKLHFTSASYRTFGERYAEEMLKLLGDVSVAPANNAPANNAPANNAPANNAPANNAPANNAPANNAPANNAPANNAPANNTPANNAPANNQWNQWGGNNDNNGGNNNQWNQWNGNNNNNNQWNLWGGNNNQWNQWGNPQQSTAQNTNSGATQNNNNQGNCSGLWGQCGGNGFTGSTCCSEGVCKVVNEYYHQCQN